MRFMGDNNGQVANTIINTGASLSEAERQRNFFDATGISCCKDAREFYELLLDDGRFSAADLRSAINQKSVRWDFGATQPTIVMPWIEPAFAWLLFGSMGLYTVAAVLALFLGNASGWVAASGFGFACFCIALMFVADKFILQPRRVAIRVREWMEQEPKK